MEVYILDSLWRREQVVDRFESLIWTERFKTVGDFELKLHSTLENRNRFVTGARLGMNESTRTMTVETVEDTTDAEGRATLTVKGRSIEKIFEDRIASKPGIANTEDSKWSLTGMPVDLAKKIVRDICILGQRDVGDIIPGMIESRGMYAEDTVAEPSDTITYEIDLMTVYSAVTQLGELYDFGLRLVRYPDSSQLHFDIYMGSDRTSSQTTLPAVIFSPNLDNLQNTTELTTIALYKNIAFVVSKLGWSVVTALDIDPSIEGFNRHVLLVKADDIDDADPVINQAKRIQRGKEELSKHRRFSAFDGEITQTSQYKYGKDYNLGDLVELQNIDGAMNVMQVVEQIFVSDSEGERSYPTLAINKFITPGSWSSWDYNQVWQDLNLSPETWADQP